MSKKVIVKLDLHDNKDKQKAMKAVSVLVGIDAISMDLASRKMTVVGTMDPVDVVSKLRKGWAAYIESVGPAKEPEKKEEPKKEEAKKEGGDGDAKKEGGDGKKEDGDGGKKEGGDGKKEEGEGKKKDGDGDGKKDGGDGKKEEGDGKKEGDAKKDGGGYVAAPHAAAVLHVQHRLHDEPVPAAAATGVPAAVRAAAVLLRPEHEHGGEPQLVRHLLRLAHMRIRPCSRCLR